MMVGPQKLKPLAFSSFDRRREVALSAGTSPMWRQAFWRGRPSLNFHRKAAKPSASSMARVGAGRGDRRLDLGAIAHDAGVLHEAADLAAQS